MFALLRNVGRSMLFLGRRGGGVGALSRGLLDFVHLLSLLLGFIYSFHHFTHQIETCTYSLAFSLKFLSIKFTLIITYSISMPFSNFSGVLLENFRNVNPPAPQEICPCLGIIGGSSRLKKTEE